MGDNLQFEYYVLNYNHNKQKVESFNIFNNVWVQELTEREVRKYLRSPKNYKYESFFAEKEIIYKSAYKTYIVLNKVIPILLLLTLIANMFLNTGILAVLVVAVIYLVTGMTYIKSSMVSKAKRIG